MVNQSLIAIQEVQSLSELEDHAVVSEIPQGESFEDMPLAQIRAQVGNFFVPSYLPSNFALSRSTSFGGTEIFVEYRRDADSRVSINTFQGTHRFQPPVKSGYVERTAVNGEPAYLIRGAWVRHVTLDGQAGPPAWSSDISIGLVFQEGDRWIEIQAAPYPERNGLSDAELMNVAKSVNTYDHVADAGAEPVEPGAGEGHGGVLVTE